MFVIKRRVLYKFLRNLRNHIFVDRLYLASYNYSHMSIILSLNYRDESMQSIYFTLQVVKGSYIIFETDVHCLGKAINNLQHEMTCTLIRAINKSDEFKKVFDFLQIPMPNTVISSKVKRVLDLKKCYHHYYFSKNTNSIKIYSCYYKYYKDVKFFEMNPVALYLKLEKTPEYKIPVEED